MTHRDITVATASLDKLFRGKPIVASDGKVVRGQLHIPEYQRPYRWGSLQLQRLTSDLGRFFGARGTPQRPFYLGTIVLHQHESNLNIIDGQQRLTSLLLCAYRLGIDDFAGCLKFSAPESQDQIRANLSWLAQRDCPPVDFARVNVTLVITHSEDDAHRFFETMNTGGVRLNGPQIIKAHHLRAVSQDQQDAYARQWETMRKLDYVVDMVMKVRYWEKLRWRELSSYRNKSKVKDEIVLELAELAGREGDLAYVHGVIARSNGSRNRMQGKVDYAMRQPLNAGSNSIRYLQHLHRLHQQLTDGEQSQVYQQAYQALVVDGNGSDYLKNFYDSALLFYVSRFGMTDLYEAALWLFRSVYAPRLENEKMVRESTVRSFAFATPILDWIGASFTHRQVIGFLRAHYYQMDENNLTAATIKGKFVMHVKNWFKLDLPADAIALASVYDEKLRAAIEQAVLKGARP